MITAYLVGVIVTAMLVFGAGTGYHERIDPYMPRVTFKGILAAHLSAAAIYGIAWPILVPMTLAFAGFFDTGTLHVVRK